MRRATSRGLLEGVRHWDNKCINSSTRMPSTSNLTSMARGVSSSRSSNQNGRHDMCMDTDISIRICSDMLPHRINYDYN